MTLKNLDTIVLHERRANITAKIDMLDDTVNDFAARLSARLESYPCDAAIKKIIGKPDLATFLTRSVAAARGRLERDHALIEDELLERELSR